MTGSSGGSAGYSNSGEDKAPESQRETGARTESQRRRRHLDQGHGDHARVADEPVVDLSPSFGKEIRAMCLMKALRAKRDTKQIGYIIFAPVIFAVLACVFAILLSSLSDLAPPYKMEWWGTDPFPVAVDISNGPDATSPPSPVVANPYAARNVTAMDRLVTGLAHSGVWTEPVLLDNSNDLTTWLNESLGDASNVTFELGFAFRANATLANATAVAAGTALPNETVSVVDAVIFRNTSLFYSPVTAGVRAVSHAILKGILGSDSWISFATYEQLFPATQGSVNDFTSGGIMYFVALGMGMTSVNWGLTLVIEREKRQKDQLMAMSLSRTGYWMGHYLFDLLSYLISATLVLVVFAVIGTDSFAVNSVMAYVATFAAFGLCIIPYSYCFSFLFDKEQTAEKWLPNVTSFTVAIPWVLTSFALRNPSHGLNSAFSVVPVYGLYYLLASLEGGPKTGRGPYTAGSIFDPSRELFLPIIIMVVEAAIFMAIIVFVDGKYYRLCRKEADIAALAQGDDLMAGSAESADGRAGDADVQAERARMAAMDGRDGGGDDVVRVHNVTKVFPRRDGKGTLRAVDGVSVGLRRGECFGLLGLNGAGKTTLINIIAGFIPATTGTIFIGDHDIARNLNAARRSMGFCPQHDALFDFLTARDHLKVFALIKGADGAAAKALADHWVAAMELEEWEHKVSKEYSGGTKRKLSVACALLCDPTVVFLDEPSSGMDPRTRQLLFRVVAAASARSAIILTSHSIEEAEILCRRICIVVNGAVRCLGSPQHLKDEYGSGYVVVIRTSDEHMSGAVYDFMTDHFPGCTLQNSSATTFYFEVPDVKLSSAFRVLEGARGELHIADYSISQPTLEQVFLTFARMQRSEAAAGAAGGGR